MKISHDGTTVSFKTEPEELFLAEKSGAKPNTVRILDKDEYQQLRKVDPKKIIIRYQQEIFLRTITNVHATEGVFGKVILVISWTNEKHHHPATRETVSHGPGDHTQSLVGPHSVPVEPGAHNAPVESVPEVSTTPPICKCANCIWDAREEEDHGLETASPTKLSELAPILLPQTLIHDLGRFRQEGLHTDFIRKLLLEHLNKLVGEGGPMEKWPNDLHPQIQTKGVEDEC